MTTEYSQKQKEFLNKIKISIQLETFDHTYEMKNFDFDFLNFMVRQENSIKSHALSSGGILSIVLQIF